LGQFSKPWEELNFSDNYIFCKVMKKKDICIEFLEILLDIKIKDVSYIESEHPIQDYYESRGIRMDVFVADSDRVFDLEMQTGDYDDLLLRSRYYLSASDLSTTPRRTKFKDLKETYIIFICKDDPFGAGIPLYTEAKCFEETQELTYNDKSHKLFYNCSAYAKAENKTVQEVLEFIYELKSASVFTKKLEDTALQAKAEPTFKDDYMYFADILEDEKEQARETGLAEGLAEGKKKSLIELIQKKLAKNKTVEQIAEDLEESVENIQKLISEMEKQ